MALHGPFGEEERGRDLAIGLPLGHEGGDPLLGRRERAGRRRPAADPTQLGTRLVGPQGGADPLTDAERLLQRLPRLAPALHPPQRRSEREQGASTIERDLDLRVPVERLLIRGERVLLAAVLRSEQATAARGHRQRRRALQPPSVTLVPVEELDGFGAAPELDQRLDVVDDETDRRRLGEALAAHECDRRLEPRGGGLGQA
jgi:hypothetical protein